MHVYSVIITTHPFKFMCIYPKELDQHYAYELLLCQTERYEKSTSHTSITKTQRTHYAQFIFDTGVSLNKNKCTMQIAAT